jgi:hypothetical protein
MAVSKRRRMAMQTARCSSWSTLVSRLTLMSEWLIGVLERILRQPSSSLAGRTSFGEGISLLASLFPRRANGSLLSAPQRPANRTTAEGVNAHTLL